MSHINKKGKTLTTKRKTAKLSSKEKLSQQDFRNNTALFDSFVSVRTSKQQKDVSLGLLSENQSNSLIAQENETDFFKFPDKKRGCSDEDKIFLETTVSPQRNIFDDETKIESFIIDSCSKSKLEEHYKPNESSLFFESNPERNYKNCDSSLVVKNDNKTSEEERTNDMCFDDIVPILDVSEAKKTTPNIVTEENLSDETEDSESDARNQCPVCLKTVGSAKYFSHIKSCAAKNKLSTQQLLSALRLHKKQLAERKQLGLGIPVQSYKARVSPKKSRINERKGPVDSSLQLALALSASLHSAQEDEVIQEAEALKEAGLCEEAERKLSTLEQYGFASALPLQPRTVAGGSKCRPLPPSLLLRRTQEERERIVTEKVAIVLISEEESMNPISFTQDKPVLKSKMLKEKWDNECQLWSKSRCPEHEKREAFYVQSLSQFVSPSRGEIGGDLRRLSQLPGRVNTPLIKDNSDLSTPCKSFTEMGKTDISDLPTPLRSDVMGRGKRFDSASQCQTNLKTFSTLSSLSKDWGKLLNSGVLSDIKIRCRDFVAIPAHKLVFYARCPRILDEIGKQAKSEDILDWENVSSDSVLAFLDFVYCGRTDKILMLNANDFFNVRSIAEKFAFAELKSHLNEAEKFLSESKMMTVVKKNLFKSDDTNTISDNVLECLDSGDIRQTSDTSFSEHVSRSNSVKILSISPSSLNSENTCKGRESPDMFGDPSITDNEIESQHERGDLDILVSLIGKPTQYKTDSNKKSISLERGESVDSPTGSSTSEISYGKRKALNISFSEDEDISLSKRHCSDVSGSQCFGNKSREASCDSTHSSNSSNEEVLDEGNERSLVAPENAMSRNRNSEEAFDLTQSSKSSSGEVCESNKCKSNNTEESDGEDSLVDLTQKHCDESISETCAKSPTFNDDDINAVLRNRNSEEPFDLTQSSKSSNGEVCESNECKSNNPEESDGEDSLVDLTQKHCDESISETCAKSPTFNDDVEPICDGFQHEDSNYNVHTVKESTVKSVKDKSLKNIPTFSTPKFSHSKMSNSIKGSPECLSSDRESVSHQFSHSPRNISSSSAKLDDVLLEHNNVQDYIDPVWEGFDDYYQFNCTNNTSLKTPMKYQKDKTLNTSLPNLSSIETFKSKRSSISPKSRMLSSNKSPRKLAQAILSPLNKSPKSIKSISSDSISPEQISQKRLKPSSSSSIKCVSSNSISKSTSKYNYKNTHHNLSIDDSDIEIIPETTSTELPGLHKTDFTKSRKNLNFQFEADLNSSQRIYSESGEGQSSGSVVAQLSPKSQTTPPVSSLRKDSLAAMQRLLDDSFEVNDSLFDTAEEVASRKKEKEPRRQSEGSSGQDCVIAGNSRSKTISSGRDKVIAGSSRSKSSLETPSPVIIVSDKVTPLPDYSGMKTPALKKELSRFGLKPSLGRRKAKLLLRYIYDQTHPVVPDAEGQTSEFKQPEGQPPRSPVKSPRKMQSSVVSPRKASHPPRKTQTVVNLGDSGSESDDPCSQMSTSSSISSASSLPEESFHEAEDILTQDLSDSGDVRSCIRSLIKGDPELHRKVLMYDPIYLEDLMSMLKAIGIKCKANDVMDFLDEQCITFRTNSWKATNEKRRQKQKSPKKKMKPQVAESLSISPPKVQSQVTKKRGRPKKQNN